MGPDIRRRVTYLSAMPRSAPAILTAVVVVAALAAPLRAQPLLEACNAATFATVLAAAPTAAMSARAVWLDRRTLRWPGVAAQGRYRLLFSSAGSIVADSGRSATGADSALILLNGSGTLLSDVENRYRHVADGAMLAVEDGDVARLRDWHRGQMVLVREDDRGRVLDATRVQPAGALDHLFADAADVPDLGVTVTARGARFRLWAPTARDVAVCRYTTGAVKSRVVLPMTRDARTGVWTAEQPGIQSGGYYAYLVDVHVPGVGLVRNRVTDPYSISLTTDSRRSYIGDLASPALAPAGWASETRPASAAAPTDQVIYELHVRDFSVNDSSVTPANRGRYGAFTEMTSRGMQHLRALQRAGVTDVHLLPVFDLATVPEAGCITPRPQGAPDGRAQQATVHANAAADCFNWGYDPFHYTAPEGSYASDAADGAVRVREMRRLVRSLHAMGLRVGMDVVYNHTSASGQHAQSVLDRIVPGYYQRLNATGEVETSTCCANTATEHRMMAKLMIESAATWARHYHIDAFRFDLMGHQPRAAMERLQRAVDSAAGRHIALIGEGWNFGEVANGARFVQASQLSLGGSGIATFSDRARDAIRGGGPGDNGRTQRERQGFITGLTYDRNTFAQSTDGATDLMHAADLVRVGLAGTLTSYRMQTMRGDTVPLTGIDYAGQAAGYAREPGEVVNYVENHDNQTLFDVSVFKLPDATSTSDRARVQTLGAALTMFSQGIAYVHAGQEVLRSKSMDRNSYDSGDWFNRLDWSLRDNFFGTGLPPARDNAESWPFMQPLLASGAIRPTPADIRFTRDAFLDLLRIRASSTLFRLRTAADVRERLTFFNTGAAQEPTVIAAHLDGAGYAGASFSELVYLVNVDTAAHTVRSPTLAGRAFVLHPVLRTPAAADPRVREAIWNADVGAFTVPARTAVVWVVEPDGR